MTVTEMLDLVKYRTKHNNDALILAELNAGMDWFFKRLFNSADGPDVLSTFGEEITPNQAGFLGTPGSRLHTYDLAANLAGSFYALKKLWLKLPGDVVFHEMIPADTTDKKFAANDRTFLTDNVPPATAHPVRYDVINFGSLRFSPPLPYPVILRADYYRKPPALDTTSNNTLTNGSDIPEPCHMTIVDKATALVAEDLNDDRAQMWERRAERNFADTIYVLQRRTQGLTKTLPYNYSGRR